MDITDQPRQWPRAADCLARAFVADPMMCFLFPGRASSRLRRLRGLYRTFLAGYARHGRILIDDQGRAVAVWQRPEPPAPDAWRTLGNTAGILLRLRGAVRRAVAIQRTTRAGRPAQPHWYLALLGSQPAGRGSGAAEALVNTVLADCDAAGLPAYLVSSNVDNIGYYQRFGFAVTEPLQVPDGPALWGMWRDSGPTK